MKSRYALFLLCALAACHRGPQEIKAQGYVEGEYLNVSPQVTGRIEEVQTREGMLVAAGTPLFKLDPLEADAQRSEAEAELARAQANMGDFEATVTRTERDFHRQEDLVKRGNAAVATLDNARQAFESSQAQLSMGKNAIEAAKATLAQADWQLSQRQVVAPAAGVIDEIYFRPGEVASAGRPVLSILPSENRKVIFFIRQADLPRVKLGAQVFIKCEGCDADIPARVTFIGNEAEFTPPVIYSLETRDKLVFKIEARPVDLKVPLRIGQPVDVLVPEPGAPA